MRMFRPRPSRRAIEQSRAALSLMLETEYPVAKSQAEEVTPRSRRRAVGGRRGSSSGSNAPAFITADDVNANGRTKFKIQPSISLYHRDDGTTSLFINIMRQDKQIFTWSVRCGSPDRISLQQMCGRNLLQWPGKVIELHRQEGSRGGIFVNLYDPSRARARQQSQRQNDDDIPF